MGRAPYGGHRLVAMAAATVVAGALVSTLAVASPALASTVTGATAGTSGTGATSGTGGSGDGGSGATTCAPATFSTAQQKLETALSDRATELTKLAGRVSQAKALPGSDATTLEGIITAEQTTVDGGGIAGLQAAVPGETTCADLAGTAKAMVQDFRVFALVAPQVDIAVCSSGSAAAVTKGTDAEPTISARIAAAGQRGVDTAGAQQAFADFEAQLSSASQALGQVDVQQVLAQVPSDYPGDRSMLTGDVSAMEQADTDLRSARADLRTIRRDLAGSATSGGAGS